MSTTETVPLFEYLEFECLLENDVIAPYNQRNTTDLLNVVYRVEDHIDHTPKISVSNNPFSSNPTRIDRKLNEQLMHAGCGLGFVHAEAASKDEHGYSLHAASVESSRLPTTNKTTTQEERISKPSD